MKVTVHSAIKHETSSRTLPEVFSVTDANARAVALAMRVYRANARQATAKTKTRGEVTMTGKKVYKQKGTGGARHGSRRAPIFVGGGVTFGPHGNQNWSLALPRRQRLRALSQAFALRATHTSMMIDLAAANGKTNTFAKAFDRIDPAARTIIMVLAPTERTLTLGLRNLERIQICYADQLNSYDVVRADRIVLSELAVEIIANRLSSSSQSPAAKNTVSKTARATTATSVKSTAISAAEKTTPAKKTTAAKAAAAPKTTATKRAATAPAPKKAAAKKPSTKK